MTVPPYQDYVKNNESTNYFNSPALDVSVAFPQATPASTFPPCTSDYYQVDDLLTPEEQAIRLRVRECMEKDVAPIMAEYWEKAEFPFQIIPKLGALRIAGGTIKGYGCPVFLLRQMLLLQLKLLELMQAVLLSSGFIPH
ncbi:unnamed protein product [Malus baccata var. baccata]